MNKLLTIIVAFLLCTLVFAQSSVKTNNTRTGNGIPVVQSGPQLASPLSTLNESFEETTFPPTGWTATSVMGNEGWTRQLAGTTPLPGWTGSATISVPPGGGIASAFVTYGEVATSNDEWLITPQITNVQLDDSLSFYTKYYVNTYLDNMDIKISTTTNDVSAFTVTVASLAFSAGGDTAWTLHSYRLGDFVTAGSNIYVAFRQHVADNVNDGSALGLDLVSITSGVPVELTTFTATSGNNSVVLNWSTATETNNKGFEVQKQVNGVYATIGFISGKGTTTEKQNYSYTDKNLEAGKYAYRLKQVDYNGTYEYSSVVETEVTTPSVFSLSQNYPNPFNPATVINYSLAVDSKVSLRIYNVLGEEVAVLLNGTMTAGHQSVNFNASSLPSGMYLYKIEAAGIDGTNFTSVKKMMLTK